MNELLLLLDFFKAIPGAISVTEGAALYNIIRSNLLTENKPGETFIDFGSYKGKSSFIAISALSAINKSGLFMMVEPAHHPNLDSLCTFSKHGPAIIPVLFSCTSEQAIAKLGNVPISYAFIDSGDHGEESIKIETDYIDPNMVEGGLIVFHDFGNQYTAPGYAIKGLVETGRYEKIEIDWEPIFAFVDEHKLEEGNDSWHWTDHPHPNFIGAIRKQEKGF